MLKFSFTILVYCSEFMYSGLRVWRHICREIQFIEIELKQLESYIDQVKSDGGLVILDRNKIRKISQKRIAQRGILHEGIRQRGILQKGITQRGITRKAIAQRAICKEPSRKELPLKSNHAKRHVAKSHKKKEAS